MLTCIEQVLVRQNRKALVTVFADFAAQVNDSNDSEPSASRDLSVYTPVSSKCYALADLIFLSRGVLKASNSQPYWEFLKRLWAKKAID